MALSTVTAPFQPWRPDLIPLASQAVLTAKNVVPIKDGYAPFQALAQIGSASLSAACKGAASFRTASGTAVVIGGTATTLESLSAGAFSDISASGGYVLADDSLWGFAQYGQRIVAVNLGVATQKFDMGTDTAFGDLSGTPPKAKCAAVVRDFLVLGDVNDSSAGEKRSRVAWSGFNNSEIWGLDVANQADSQDLAAEYGRVQAIVGREYGTIFQETAITRMTYVGPPVVFQFDVLETARGAFAPYSVVSVGRTSFYLAVDGFYAFDGAQSVPIGRDQVDRWVISRIDYTSRNSVIGVADFARSLVIWAFPSVPASQIDTLVMYSWKTGTWSMAEVDLEYLFPSVERGYTLEELNAFGTLDTLPYSLDSDHWKGGKLALAAFDTDHKYSSFSGGTLEATLETSEVEVAPGYMSYISQGRVLTDATPIDQDPSDAWLMDTDGNTITDTEENPIGDTSLQDPWGVQIGSRPQFPGDPVTWTTLSRPTTDGSVPLRAAGRFCRARVILPKDSRWTYITAMEVTGRASGKR